MRILSTTWAIAGTLILNGWAAPSHGQSAQEQTRPARSNLAQKLVEDAKVEHADVVTAGIHAKKPGSDQWEIIAHTNPNSVGHKSEGADLVTLNTGKPDGPNPLADGVFDVGVPLKDAKGRRIGFLAVHVRPPAGSANAQAAALKEVMRISNELSKRIPSAAALFAPAG